MTQFAVIWSKGNSIFELIFTRRHNSRKKVGVKELREIAATNRYLCEDLYRREKSDELIAVIIFRFRCDSSQKPSHEFV